MHIEHRGAPAPAAVFNSGHKTPAHGGGQGQQGAAACIPGCLRTGNDGGGTDEAITP
jgi:hypothetical protein